VTALPLGSGTFLPLLSTKNASPVFSSFFSIIPRGKGSLGKKYMMISKVNMVGPLWSYFNSLCLVKNRDGQPHRQMNRLVERQIRRHSDRWRDIRVASRRMCRVSLSHRGSVHMVVLVLWLRKNIMPLPPSRSQSQPKAYNHGFNIQRYAVFKLPR
jgi:hypothetical protein